MLLILAHAADTVARQIAAAWAPEARVILPRHLSAPGWRHFPAGGGDDTVVVEGKVVPAAEIRGVLVRISAIGPADLPHIAEVDRGYVATEMTAFLSSLLMSLPCPVVNRPSASSLMRPGWSAERWRAAAWAAGIKTAGSDRGELVTVVGTECFGAPGRTVAARALALAALARVDMLPLRMTPDARFAGVEPWACPPPAALDALRALLMAAPRECVR